MNELDPSDWIPEEAWSILKAENFSDLSPFQLNFQPLRMKHNAKV